MFQERELLPVYHIWINLNIVPHDFHCFVGIMKRWLSERLRVTYVGLPADGEPDGTYVIASKESGHAVDLEYSREAQTQRPSTAQDRCRERRSVQCRKVRPESSAQICNPRNLSLF
jgi:hypothetical protein